jgi:hypothetical protein
LFFEKLLQFEANYRKCMGKFTTEKCDDIGNPIEDAKKDHKSGMSQEDTQAR